MNWISTKERLPEKEVVVLICSSDGDFQYRGLGYVDEDQRWFKGIKQLLFVTHWMPLPEPPKE